MFQDGCHFMFWSKYHEMNLHFDCYSNVIIKKRIITQPDEPQINSQLRNVMYQKHMSQNKHWHDKNNQRLWDEFRVK